MHLRFAFGKPNTLTVAEKPKGLNLRTAPIRMELYGTNAIVTLADRSAFLAFEGAPPQRNHSTSLDLIEVLPGGRTRPVRHLVLPEDLLEALHKIASKEPVPHQTWQLTNGAWRKAP